MRQTHVRPLIKQDLQDEFDDYVLRTTVNATYSMKLPKMSLEMVESLLSVSGA